MSENRMMKSFDELQFRDDFMVGNVMEDPELCRLVLECLLQRPVGELTEVQTQREFKYTSDGKPMRLDVYNEDMEGRIKGTIIISCRKAVFSLSVRLTRLSRGGAGIPSGRAG